MAKDDYFVIVYQIPAYLYQRLKRGEPADGSMISEVRWKGIGVIVR